MKSSDALENLSISLVAAQAELANPKTDQKAKVKTKTGADYSYAYLSLPALLDVVRPVLATNHLAVTQEIVAAERGIGVITRIVHASGQWLELGPLVLPAGGNAQEHGSAITYGKRYALAAAFGIAAEEDDDGAAASKASGSSSRSPAVQVVPPSSSGGAERSSRDELHAREGGGGTGVPGSAPAPTREAAPPVPPRASGVTPHKGCKNDGIWVLAEDRPGWIVCEGCGAQKVDRGDAA